jgi:putative phage-type endonuclease
MESHLIQGSESWKELRKQFVTSTDASVIMSCNPWKTPYKLFRQKMDLDPPDEETDRMRIGTQLEPLAREWFIKQTGIQCEPKVVFRDFMMASLDGISECGNFIVEIKCGEKAFSSACDGNIPKYYLDQIFHQLYVSDVHLCYYVAFNEHTGIIIPVERDQEFINEMIPKLREFYECLLTYTPPPMTTKDYNQRSDPEWIDLSQRYRNAYEAKKNAEQLEESLRKELILCSGGQSTMGSDIKLSKITKKGNISYSNIPEVQQLNLEKYRSAPCEYWKISVQ